MRATTRTLLYVATAFLMLTMSIPAFASTVDGTVTGGTAFTAGGTFVSLSVPLSNLFGPPDSVGNDNFQSPNLFEFAEQQSVTLTSPLTVDVGTSPIPTGTTVSSYYVFFDPGPTQNIIGTVNFGSDVLGIMTSTGTLALSDFLGASGVNYLNPANRGLEAGDSVTISGSQQILVDVSASSPGDYVRVITAATPATTNVPEPGGIAPLAGGILALAAMRGRKLLGSAG